MAKKRGHGEGTISQVKGRDLWAGRITVGNTTDGKRVRRAVYGKTRKEVVERLARLQNQKLDGLLNATSSLTVAAFLQQWLDSIRLSVRSTTHASYANNVRLHINPRIGGQKLSTLTPAQVQGVYAAMAAAGKSPRMQQLIHTILRRALSQGMKWGILAKNVCDAVDRPRVSKFEFKALDTSQVQRLLQAITGNRLEAVFVLAVTTGLRLGEVLGLHWADIDLDAGTLSVRRTLNQLNGKPFYGEPKTAKSRRQVFLPAMAIDALHEHRRRMLTEGHAGSEAVFCTRAGEMISQSILRRRYWLPILKAAELPLTTRFHDLRHTAATLLLGQGVHPKIVQEMLGHSTITLTLDTYSHVLPTMQAEAAGKMDRLLKRIG